VYKANKNPTYARRKRGVPIQILHDEDYNECLTLADRLEKQLFRPQYVVIYEQVWNDSLFGFEACMHKFNQLGMYELERYFYSDLEDIQGKMMRRFRRPRFLFKLKPHLKPL